MANLIRCRHRRPRATDPQPARPATPVATERGDHGPDEALGRASLAAPNERISRMIKVELDFLETLI